MLTQKAVKIIGITFLICLSSCKDPNGYPRLKDFEQRSPVFVYTQVNGKNYIDIENSYCLSRMYRISKDYIGPVDKYGEEFNLNEKETTVFVKELPIEACNKVIGPEPITYGTYATWLENMRIWLNRQ